MRQRGCLAIWTRIEPAHLVEYRRWLSTEHIGQRLDIEGVRSARVFARHDDEHSHFILYNVDGADLFRQQAYLDVLNNPTPWTKAMMPRLQDFDRAVGIELVKHGQGAGAFVSVGRLEGVSNRTDTKALNLIRDMEGFAALRVFQVERAATDLASTEKTMRSGNEGQFGHLLVAEAMLKDVPRRIFELAASAIAGRLVGDVDDFRQVYMLNDSDREHGLNR